MCPVCEIMTHSLRSYGVEDNIQSYIGLIFLQKIIHKEVLPQGCPHTRENTLYHVLQAKFMRISSEPFVTFLV